MPVAFNTTVAVVYPNWRPPVEEGEAKILAGGDYLRSARPRMASPAWEGPYDFWAPSGLSRPASSVSNAKPCGYCSSRVIVRLRWTCGLAPRLRSWRRRH
jgi:hypothetical protein